MAATLARVAGRPAISEPKTDRLRTGGTAGPAVVAMLRRHRTEQKAQRLAAEAMDRLGPGVHHGARGLVDPRNLLRVIEAAAKAAGVAGVGVHTLRHPCGGVMAEGFGVHIKAVSDLLGHSSIAITGDVYGHTSDDQARAAIERAGPAARSLAGWRMRWRTGLLESIIASRWIGADLR